MMMRPELKLQSGEKHQARKSKAKKTARANIAAPVTAPASPVTEEEKETQGLIDLEESYLAQLSAVAKLTTEASVKVKAQNSS